jgi:hypothetical protein
LNNVNVSDVVGNWCFWTLAGTPPDCQLTDHYSLVNGQVAPPDSYEPNDTSDTAAPIALSADGSAWIKANSGLGNTDDWYTFTVDCSQGDPYPNGITVNNIAADVSYETGTGTPTLYHNGIAAPTFFDDRFTGNTQGDYWGPGAPGYTDPCDGGQTAIYTIHVSGTYPVSYLLRIASTPFLGTMNGMP